MEIQERKDEADDDNESAYTSAKDHARSPTSGDASVPAEDNASEDDDGDEAESKQAPNLVAPDSPIGEGTEDTFV